MKSNPSISKRQMLQFALGAAALAVSASAMAQDTVRQAGPGTGGPDIGVPGGGAITLRCCRCVGDSMPTPILTGTSPFTMNGSPAPLVNPPLLTQLTTANPPLWTTAPPAKWIGPGNANAGLYTYQLKIVLPRGCALASKIQIVGKYWADDDGTVAIAASSGVTVTGSGTPTLTTSPSWNPSPGGWGFLTTNAGGFNYSVTGSGVVTLTFTAKNGGAGPTGLLVRGELVQRCATDSGGMNPIEVPPPPTTKE